MAPSLSQVFISFGEVNYQETRAEMGEGSPIPEADTPTRGHYLHELKDYAVTYRRFQRQIRRWITAGRYAKRAEMLLLDALTPDFISL